MLPEDHPEEADNLTEGWEGFLNKYKYPLLVFLMGALVVGVGVFFAKDASLGSSGKIEVLDASDGATEVDSVIVVEISGEVVKPGVYRLPKNSRVEDLLVLAGGFSANSDRVLIEKSLNRAALLSDGQKIYIPAVGEQSLGTTATFSTGPLGVGGVGGSGAAGPININIASQAQLEELPGIGPVYAQNIIEHRPYSNVEELVSKGAIKQNVFNKIKDSITAF